jgi:ATPase subunit of ABC transporter with duplicated ATPase domains
LASFSKGNEYTRKQAGEPGDGAAITVAAHDMKFVGVALIISHDRWFLDRVATHILAAEGDSRRTFFDGNYQEYEADKKKRLGEEGAKPRRIRYRPIRR